MRAPIRPIKIDSFYLMAVEMIAEIFEHFVDTRVAIEGLLVLVLDSNSEPVTSS